MAEALGERFHKLRLYEESFDLESDDEDTAERAPFTGINLRSARSVGSLPIPDSAYEKVKSSIVLLESIAKGKTLRSTGFFYARNKKLYLMSVYYVLPSEVAISSATFYFDYKGEDDRGTPVKVTEVMKACGEEYCIHTNENFNYTLLEMDEKKLREKIKYTVLSPFQAFAYGKELIMVWHPTMLGYTLSHQSVECPDSEGHYLRLSKEYDISTLGAPLFSYNIEENRLDLVGCVVGTWRKKWTAGIKMTSFLEIFDTRKLSEDNSFKVTCNLV